MPDIVIVSHVPLPVPSVHVAESAPGRARSIAQLEPVTSTGVLFTPYTDNVPGVRHQRPSSLSGNSIVIVDGELKLCVVSNPIVNPKPAVTFTRFVFAK